MENFLATLSSDLEKTGATIPRISSYRVEEMRTRGPTELPFVHYLSERLAEKVALLRKGLFWSRKNRCQLDTHERSRYLDGLDLLWKQGEFDSLQLDEIVREAILDPNYAMYVRWSLKGDRGDGLTWRDHVRELEHAFTNEASLFSRNASPFSQNATVTEKDVNAAIKVYASRLELDTVLLPRSNTEIIGKQLTDQWRIILKWGDKDLLKRRGNLLLSIVLRRGAGPEIPPERAEELLISLDDMYCNGEWYVRTVGDKSRLMWSSYIYFLSVANFHNGLVPI